MIACPIVHIGYHKTATTWFQRQFWPSVTSHRYVARETAQAALLDPPGMMLDVERARALLLDPSDARPPVLCEENFSGYIHNNGLHGLVGPKVASRIARVLPDAQIVIFLRSQPEMIRASYAQYVYAGGTYSPERYLFPARSRKGALAQPYKAPHFAFSHFRYLELLRLYREQFGRKNVHVFLYEAFRDDHQAFLDSFRTRLGIVQQAEAPASERENRSWEARSIAVARQLNRFTRRSVADKQWIVHVPGVYGARKPVCDWLGRLPGGERFKLPVELEESIAIRFAPSNRELAAEFSLPLGDYGYPMSGLSLVEGGRTRAPMIPSPVKRQIA